MSSSDHAEYECVGAYRRKALMSLQLSTPARKRMKGLEAAAHQGLHRCCVSATLCAARVQVQHRLEEASVGGILHRDGSASLAPVPMQPLDDTERTCTVDRLGRAPFADVRVAV